MFFVTDVSLDNGQLTFGLALEPPLNQCALWWAKVPCQKLHWCEECQGSVMEAQMHELHLEAEDLWASAPILPLSPLLRAPPPDLLEPPTRLERT